MGYNNIKHELDVYLNNDDIKDENSYISLNTFIKILENNINRLNNYVSFLELLKRFQTRVSNYKRINNKDLFSDKRLDNIYFSITSKDISICYKFKSYKNKKTYELCLKKDRFENDMYIDSKEGIFTEEQIDTILQDYNEILLKANNLEEFYDELNQFYDLGNVKSLEDFMKHIDMKLSDTTHIFNIDICYKLNKSSVSPSINVLKNITLRDDPQVSKILDRNYVLNIDNTLKRVNLRELARSVMNNVDVSKKMGFNVNEASQYYEFLIKEYLENDKSKSLILDTE